ncbi:MAG: hypothetical protein WC303_01825 [Candidatus Paceibacterota bacterium]|jgi:hypothetical protein
MIDRLYLTQDDEVQRFIVSDSNIIAAKQLRASKMNRTIYAPLDACEISSDSFTAKDYNGTRIRVSQIIGWYDRFDKYHFGKGLHSLVISADAEIWEIVQANSCYITRKLGTISERIQQWVPKEKQIGDRYEDNGKHVVIYRGEVELHRIDWISSRYDRRINKQL